MPRLAALWPLLWLAAPVWAAGRRTVTLKLKQLAPRASPGTSLLEVASRQHALSGSRARARLRARTRFAGPPRTEFFATINIGTPPQQFIVALDTGSGNLLVPARDCPDMACKAHRGFDRFLSTSARDVITLTETEHHMINWPPRKDAEKLTLFFGTGKATGQAVNDKVCIGPLKPGENLCTRQNFVAADSMTQEPFGLLPFDGVLGLGLPELSATPEFNLMGEFAEKEMFMHNRLAIWLNRPEDGEDSEITFGDFNPARIAARIVWVRTTNHPGSKGRSGFWQITVSDVAIGNQVLGFGAEQAAVDTGTSVITGPSTMINALEAQLGIKQDCSNLKDGTLPLLGFLIEGVILNLEPKDYIYKSGEQCYSQLMPLDLPPPKGPLILLGDPWLRKYYTIFDRDSLKLGLTLAVHKTGPDQVNLLTWAHKMMVVTE